MTNDEATTKGAEMYTRLESDESLEAICKDVSKLMPDLDGPAFLAFVRALTNHQPGVEPPRRERLRDLNVLMNKEETYMEAVTRFHKWKEAQPESGEH